LNISISHIIKNRNGHGSSQVACQFTSHDSLLCVLKTNKRLTLKTTIFISRLLKLLHDRISKKEFIY